MEYGKQKNTMRVIYNDNEWMSYVLVAKSIL